MTRWAIRRVTDWAERSDDRRGVTANLTTMLTVPPVGWATRLWALLKLLVIALLLPVAGPLVAARAAVSQLLIRRVISDFPHQFREVKLHRHPLPPANRVRRIASPQRAFISSDLHRCIPGRNDWPARQDTKVLYSAVIDFYADHDAHLVENGDIEDYWMSGGSMYGTVYDLLRIVHWLLPARFATFPRHEAVGGHLDRIIANNSDAYARIRDRFARHGRYHRTIGNHDDVYQDRFLARRLADRVGVDPVDWLVFDGPDGTTEAIIAHGHHTDGWCAPGRDRLGKLSSWVAGSLVDVPHLDKPEGLPPEDATAAVLDGRAPNRLLRVNPVFGVSRSYDSLDEEALFEAMGAMAHDGPWLIFGHTHVPVQGPLSRSGSRWDYYANSGCGLLPAMLTGLEWHRPADPEAAPEVILVAWTYATDETPPAAVVATDGDRDIARYVLRADGTGRLGLVVEPYGAGSAPAVP